MGKNNWVLIFLFFISSHSLAVNTFSFQSANDTARFQTLSNEIRCVVCQNQSLAESDAPLANDIRQKIYTMISEGENDEKIKDYLVRRYGEFILLRPRFNTNTYVLWIFPFLGLGVLFPFLLKFIKIR